MRLKTKFQDEDFGLGEVVEGVIVECLGKHEEELRVIATAAKGGQHTFYYSSIKKFMDDWEDAPEEPKGYWYIDTVDNDVTFNSIANEDDKKADQEIGNYFSSKEEAEKAVEKLKAWKRLKDFGCGFILDDHFTVKFVGPDATKITSAEEQKSLSDAYKLLFGGEE